MKEAWTPKVILVIKLKLNKIKSSKVLTRSAHAKGKFLCQANVLLHILSVLLPISSRQIDFSRLPT